MSGRRRWWMAAVFLTPLPLVGVSILAGRACDQHQSAHTLGHAVWTDSGLLLLEHLNRSGDDGPSYVIHRIVAIDPASGAVTGPWMLPETEDMQTTVLWASRGPWVWMVRGDAWHPEWVVGRFGEEPVGIDTLAARFPEVAAPWAAALVGQDGVLRVESDDKRQWEVDVAAGKATERPGLSIQGTGWSGADNVGCLMRSWKEEGQAFVEREAARHSQLDHFALVTAAIDEYGQVTETGELAGGFSGPSFLCDGNGHVATVAGDALVVEHTPALRIVRVGRSGERVWTWSPAAEGATIEAWSGPGDGATIRLDRTFYGLARDGTVRWTVER